MTDLVGYLRNGRHSMGKKSRSKADRRLVNRAEGEPPAGRSTDQAANGRDRAEVKRLASSPPEAAEGNEGDLPGEAVGKVLDRQRQRFIERFGREPGPDDPVFFDQEAASPNALDEATLRAQLARPGMAKELGVEPAFLAAVLEVGYAVTDQTRHLFSDEDLRAFDEAFARHSPRADG